MSIYLLYFVFVLIATTTSTQPRRTIDTFRNQYLEYAPFFPIQHFGRNKAPGAVTTVSVFYGSQDTECRIFFTKYLSELISKLGNDVHIYLYPFGKSAISINYNQKITYWCENGETECYGNQLHGTANAVLGPNNSLRLQLIICMMGFDMPGNGSNNDAADKCAAKLNISEKLISDIEILTHYYGAYILRDAAYASVHAGYRAVPYVEINNEQWSGKPENLIRDVCRAMKNRPETCKNF